MIATRKTARWAQGAAVAVAAVLLAACGAARPSAARSSVAPSTSAVTSPATSPAGSAATVPPTTPGTASTTTALKTTAPTTTASTTTASTTTASTPTLGRRTGAFGVHGQGFGQVEPRSISNGGDPTGDVSNITWSSWGATEATGTGLSDWVGPGQSVATGTEESARVVAFDLGECDGSYGYSAVEWYFPEHGQRFQPGTFEDACTGFYYPITDQTYEDGETGSAPYELRLTGAGTGLGGTIEAASAGNKETELFAFTATAAVDGAFALESHGPADTGRTYTGTWGDGGISLPGCHAWLPAVTTGGEPVSCVFP